MFIFFILFILCFMFLFLLGDWKFVILLLVLKIDVLSLVNFMCLVWMFLGIVFLMGFLFNIFFFLVELLSMLWLYFLVNSGKKVLLLEFLFVVIWLSLFLVLLMEIILIEMGDSFNFFLVFM